MTTVPDYDLCIIGGGINGAGIARDAIGRGLSVILLEAQDLAGATSSASTKLIHGGLRYLEYYEFRLVREALKERERLLSIAPHIIRPLEFILPHDAHLRPRWMIRAGLFLYDHLGGRRRLAHSKSLNLGYHPAGSALKDTYHTGFSYADCWVDDARLVVLNAMDAADRGATVLTRTACTKLMPLDKVWKVDIKNMRTLAEKSFTAGQIVNAAGPWVHGVLDASGLTRPNTPHVRLVKGSHIIIPRLFEGDYAYILQQPDRRIIFAIPYERDFTLIGTTDIDYSGDPSHVTISEEETSYLCEAINRSFKKQIGPADIIHTYSGVRPLFDDGEGKAAAVTRDYKLVLDKSFGPPILSVFGGKITTYRKLSEHAVDDLFGKKPWTAREKLPGGNFGNAANIAHFMQLKARQYEWLPADVLARYGQQYGSLLDKVIGDAKGIADMGENLGDTLFEAEVRYLVKYEWARTAEDILWRRTKLGLHISRETAHALDKILPAIVKEITGH